MRNKFRATTLVLTLLVCLPAHMQAQEKLAPTNSDAHKLLAEADRQHISPNHEGAAELTAMIWLHTGTLAS